MPKSELLGRLRGRRKAKVLVDNEWRPSADFEVLCDKIYQHIIRTDNSSLNGVPSVDVRKYLNWWKLRTYGRNLEFSNLQLSLIEREEEAALCLLLEAAHIPYDLSDHDGHRIAVLKLEGFRSLLLWNVKIDPYESLKCFNETTQSSDFRENGDKKISFLAMPRSHLPEIPDIRAQAILSQWKTDLIDALKRERLNRLTASRTAKRSSERPTRQAPPSSPRKEREPTRLRPAPHRELPSSRSTRPSTNTSTATSKPTPSSSSAPPLPNPTPSLSNSTVSITSTDSSTTTTALAEPEIVEVDDPAPAPASAPDHTWRNVAWTIGSRVLYEALAALGREHSVRTEERQLNMRLAAAAAEQNQQFWTNVASWGAWSAHTALQYYFGSAGSRGNNLIGNS